MPASGDLSQVFTLLGSGDSLGVPRAGNKWGKCDPNNPKNRRSRACAIVQFADHTLVIDIGADFRYQMNDANIVSIDTVFLTHHHADHVNGLDDLRSYFNRTIKKPIPIYMQPQTITALESRFPYLSDTIADYIPVDTSLEKITFHQCGDLSFSCFLQDHRGCYSLGFRFGDLAYSTDMADLNQLAIDHLKGIKTWIVDGSAYHNKDTGKDTHANLDKIYTLNQEIGAQFVYITNIGAAVDYQTLADELPAGYYPAYDGLSFKL
jgi:phosphoribosyl 1,2-cyclic phosphate phosphodiesterase